MEYKNTPIKLFDFDHAIESVSQVFHDFSLPSVVSEIPYDAAWQYQKSPKVSQVIGSWLRTFSSSLGVAGILFRSTKRNHGTNLFLFFNDELKDAESKLNIHKV